MSFDWSEYLRLAEQLRAGIGGQASTEAQRRAAISRAYYAAFIEARNHLRDKDGLDIPNNRDVHKFVAQVFLSSRQPRRKDIGKLLEDLRKQRNKADYDDIFLDLARLSERSVVRARRILRLLAGL